MYVHEMCTVACCMVSACVHNSRFSLFKVVSSTCMSVSLLLFFLFFPVRCMCVSVLRRLCAKKKKKEGVRWVMK